MLHDGVHSYRFALRIDRSSYDTYAITALYFVRTFRLQYRLRVLTYV